MAFDSNEPLLGIGLAAKKLGVSPELLRLYEREGLVITHKTNIVHYCKIKVFNTDNTRFICLVFFDFIGQLS